MFWDVRIYLSKIALHSEEAGVVDFVVSFVPIASQYDIAYPILEILCCEMRLPLGLNGVDHNKE